MTLPLKGERVHRTVGKRRRAVLSLMAEGGSARQIAGALGTTRGQIETDIKALRHALKAKNPRHLIAQAFRAGWLE